MKLKNKKTGEIGEIGHIGSSSGKLNVEAINGVACETIASYSSLAELNAEWEDYEEPKEWYYIDISGVVKQGEDNVPTHLIEDMEQIGNYFENREKAEKAVEKLKAWKRLKDKGFRFERWCFSKEEPKIIIKGNCVPDTVEELDLLFGGEE